MAIASLLLVVSQNNLALTETVLSARTDILEFQALPDNAQYTGFAVVLEANSSVLSSTLEAFRSIPGVEETHLVFANFEDDIDANGHMPCAAHDIPNNENSHESVPSSS